MFYKNLKLTRINFYTYFLQIVENHDVINKLPARKTSSYTELVFKAHLPPLGFTTFVIEKTLSGN